jgi:hypothetical protein
LIEIVFLRILGLWLKSIHYWKAHNIFLSFLKITFHLYFTLLAPLKENKRKALGSWLSNVIFGFLIVVTVNIIIWWDERPCTLIEMYRSLE